MQSVEKLIGNQKHQKHHVNLFLMYFSEQSVGQQLAVNRSFSFASY